MNYRLGMEHGPGPVPAGLTALWRVDEDSEYRCAFPETYPGACVAIRTVSGCGTLEDQTGTLVLEPGTLALLPPRTILSYGTRGSRWGFYWFDFTCPLPPPRLLLRPSPSPLEEELLRRTERELSRQRTGVAGAAFGLLLQLWLSGEDAGTDPVAEAAGRIELGSSDPSFSLARLPEQLGLSERTLRERFRRRYGCTPFAYLDARRLETARHLLQYTDMSGAAIAARAGFSSEFYFSRWFKSRHGEAPSRFRARHRP